MESITGLFNPTQSPLVLVGLVGGVLVLIIYFRMQRKTEREENSVRVLAFDRTFFSELTAKSFDGLVTYVKGGFIEQVNRSLPFFYGRPFFPRKGVPTSGRHRISLYLSRIGDPAPMNMDDDDLKPDKVSDELYETYKEISVERAVNRGKADVTKGEINETLIAIGSLAAMLLAVATWAVIIFGPLLGFIPKTPPT